MSELAGACNRHFRARLRQAGGLQNPAWLQPAAAGAESWAVLQGDAAGSSLTADLSGDGRSEGSAMVPNGRHILSGRRKLVGAGPGANGAAETTAQVTGRRLAGAGPGANGAAETTALATGRRLAGHSIVQGRKLLDATTGEAVSGSPADTVVRDRYILHAAC